MLRSSLLWHGRTAGCLAQLHACLPGPYAPPRYFQSGHSAQAGIFFVTQGPLHVPLQTGTRFSHLLFFTRNTLLLHFFVAFAKECYTLNALRQS